MMEDELMTTFGLEGERIRQVMDGADPVAFAPRTADPDLRAGLGIDEHAIVLAYMGLLSEQQGIERMLRALPDVLEQQPKTHLFLIGYPIGRWQALAQEMDIAEHVTFAGRVNYANTADYLALADLTLAPKTSQTEGNGKVYYYMSMALPVVAIDSVGNRELLGDDGFYAANGEPSELASAIVDALRRRSEWEARGHRLRERLIDRFTWAAVGSRLIAAYQEQSTAFALDV
jgi:glycosyltransferase involved in cell wall biosynthesis